MLDIFSQFPFCFRLQNVNIFVDKIHTFLKRLDMICLTISYHILMKKNPYNLTFKSNYFAISHDSALPLYTAKCV